MIFYYLSYWKHVKISHLLDPMHILKNVSSSLWRNISSKQTHNLDVRRYIIYSNTKNKHYPRQESRWEFGPSWSFKVGDVQWVLHKDNLSLENEVILDVKVPSLYCSTLWHWFTIKEHLSRLKSRDHIILIRVCMSKKCFYFYFLFFMP